jgi:two-component sensor histidine kinase
MFSGSDEQLINALRHIEDSRLSNEVRSVAGAAADRIEAMSSAFELLYNDARPAPKKD